MVARRNKEIEDERRMLECRQCKWDSVLWDNMVFIVSLHEKHLVSEMKCGVHLIINQKLFDFECNKFFNYLCVYLIWKRRSTRPFIGNGVVGYNIIVQRVNGPVKVLGILCYSHETLINQCQILTRFYVYHGLVGIKMNVYFLGLRMYISKVLVGLLYVCNLKITNRINGSKRRDCDYKGCVVILIAGVVWYLWDSVNRLLGIFKPQSIGSTEQYKHYHI